MKREQKGRGEEEKRKATELVILLQLIYQFNATSIKILECFKELAKSTLKNYCKVGAIKTFYKAIIIKTVMF